MTTPLEPNPDAPVGVVPGAAMPFASWGRRALAGLVDGAIFFTVPQVLQQFAPSLAAPVGFILLLVLGYLVGTTGQSPGKMLLKVRIVTADDGVLLGGWVGIFRQLSHILDAIPFGLGYLWPLWDAKKQTFADKLAGSVALRV